MFSLGMYTELKICITFLLVRYTWCISMCVCVRACVRVCACVCVCVCVCVCTESGIQLSFCVYNSGSLLYRLSRSLVG